MTASDETTFETGLGHRLVPALLVRGMGETLAFYRTLGFRLTGCHPDRTKPEWAEVTRDSVVLQFHTEPPCGTPPKPVCSGTFYLFPMSVSALADSVAFDFHKWMYVPYEAGCVLVRDPARLRTPFAVPASYLQEFDRGIAAQPDSTNLKSLQLSRGFKALKVWLMIKEHGLATFGRLIARNIAQARYLARRIEAAPSLELMAPVPLNVVCFRYRAAGLDPAALDALNAEILMRLQEDGLAVPSSTVLDGRFALRVAICNHRSRCRDFDFLVEQVARLGGEIRTGRFGPDLAATRP